MQQEQIKPKKWCLDLINQIFEIEKKIGSVKEQNSINRNINKLKDILENEMFDQDGIGEVAGLVYHNPIGEDYNETRTDCEASIAGTSTNNLIITEVIKPIVRFRKGIINQIVQKGVVIAESQK